MRVEGQIVRGGVRDTTVEGPPNEGQSERYSLAKILGIWAAAALPMGILAWVVAHIERDNAEPQFRTIRKLAKALDVDPTELLGD